MERVKFIRHGGKEILLLDFSNSTVDEVCGTIEAAKGVIRTRPEGSLLTLSDVTNARFNEHVTQRMKEFTAHNKPYVKAAAVIGISGFKRVIFEAVLMFSKRKIHTFETIDQAKDWLVKN